ncbi:hypothetical protein T4E_7413, partial [Trichinella pseudospiralis]
LCGKAKSSNTESVDASLNSVWPALRQQYNDEDIFNGDETGVFYGLGPKRNLILFILDSVSNDFGTVSLLQPIRLLYDAWESVTPECMKNCFKKAKLTNDSYCNDENDLPLTMWLRRESISQFDEISELLTTM